VTAAIEPDRQAPAYDPNHIAEGLAVLAKEFKGSVRIQAWIASYLKQVQYIEDALWAIVSLLLDNATGDALDQYGRVIGIPRGTISDDSVYRILLKAGVRARMADGSPESIIAVVRLAVGTIPFAYAEGSASVCIDVLDAITDLTALLLVVRLARDAAIGVQVTGSATAASGRFTFSASQFFPSTSSTQGFADTAQTTGGKLNGVVS